MTVSEIEIECVVPPLAPFKVMVRVPVRALVVALMVATEDPEPGAAMDVGLKLTVTPVGRLLAERATAALNPPATLELTVVVLLLPRVTVTEVGDAVTAKLGGTVTVNVTMAVCVSPPPVPVMVMG